MANDTIGHLQSRIGGELVVTVEFQQNVSANKLQQIRHVKRTESLGGNRWHIVADANKDIRGDIFRFSVDNQLTLLEMHKEVVSVEDVFTELTK